eukprot:6378921-Prymnesium_polylepis.1
MARCSTSCCETCAFSLPRSVCGKTESSCVPVTLTPKPAAVGGESDISTASSARDSGASRSDDVRGAGGGRPLRRTYGTGGPTSSSSSARRISGSASAFSTCCIISAPCVSLPALSQRVAPSALRSSVFRWSMFWPRNLRSALVSSSDVMVECEDVRGPGGGAGKAMRAPRRPVAAREASDAVPSFTEQNNLFNS